MITTTTKTLIMQKPDYVQLIDSGATCVLQRLMKKLLLVVLITPWNKLTLLMKHWLLFHVSSKYLMCPWRRKKLLSENGMRSAKSLRSPQCVPIPEFTGNTASASIGQMEIMVLRPPLQLIILCIWCCDCHFTYFFNNYGAGLIILLESGATASGSWAP